MKTEIKNEGTIREHAIDSWLNHHEESIKYMENFMKFMKLNPTNDEIKNEIQTKILFSDIYINTDIKRYIYLLLVHMCDEDLIRFIVGKFGNIYVKRTNSLPYIIQFCNIEIVKFLIDNGLDKYFSFVKAVQFDRLDVIKVLMKEKYIDAARLMTSLLFSENDEIIDFVLNNIPTNNGHSKKIKNAMIDFHLIRKNEFDISKLTATKIHNLTGDTVDILYRAALAYNRVDIIRLIKTNINRYVDGAMISGIKPAIQYCSIDALRCILMEDPQIFGFGKLDLYDILYKSKSINELNNIKLAKFFIEEYGLVPSKEVVMYAKDIGHVKLAKYLESKLK